MLHTYFLDGNFVAKFKYGDTVQSVSVHHTTLLKYGAGLAAGVGLGLWTYEKFTDMRERNRLRTLVKQKQADRENQFVSLRSTYKMSQELKEIVELPLETLIQRLQTRELTAKKALEAYIAKSLEATDEFDCITEFVPRAMEMAEELDKYENPKGPLHGVPFCVKDDTHLEGVDSMVGCAKNLYKPSSQSAVMVQALIDLGAVPYCRTNTPQTCSAYASHNPVFGETLNPLNKALGPGGSSSGTGALLGAKACRFGTGSDTGGSARHPAHFCGIASIKTTRNRVSRRGSMYCIQNAIGLPPTPCIMAQRAADVAGVFRFLSETNLMHKYDPKAVPLGWNTQLFESTHKLRIGYFTSLEGNPSLGDTPATVLKAKSILESLGHTVIPFELTNVAEYNRILANFCYADLGQHFKATLKHEDVSPCLKGLFAMYNVSNWQRKLISFLPPMFRLGWLQRTQEGMSVRYSSDLWDTVADRTTAVNSLLDDLKELRLDLIIAPVAATPALPLEVMNNAPLDSYLAIWNLLDFPAGVVQVGHESGQNIPTNSNYPQEPNDSHFTTLAKRAMKETVGMPIGVQVIGKPYEEELVLRVMVELEKNKDN